MENRFDNPGISPEYRIFFEIMARLQKALINNETNEKTKEIFFDLAYFVNVYFDKIEKSSLSEEEKDFISVYRKKLAKFLRAVNHGKKSEAAGMIFFLKGSFYDHIIKRNRDLKREMEISA